MLQSVFLLINLSSLPDVSCSSPGSPGPGECHTCTGFDVAWCYHVMNSFFQGADSAVFAHWPPGERLTRCSTQQLQHQSVNRAHNRRTINVRRQISIILLISVSCIPVLPQFKRKECVYPRCRGPGRIGVHAASASCCKLLLTEKTVNNIYKCAALQEKFGAPCCAP